ncbi:hypothetical protein [Kitasatospora sp. NPDC127116]|uniref:hypothetical protein n=1 Tax=Kitasatospora sp. NPDC127116 TaxID=3345367 RepID=UPI0036382656
MHPVLSRTSSVDDLLTGLAATAARNGRPLRVLDAWEPVTDLAKLPPAVFARELAAHLPTVSSPAQAIRSRLVWQCALRADPGFPQPSDARFAQVARRILAATGIARPDDPHACRWVVIRTDEHEARIIAPLARADGTLAETTRDRALALAVCQLDEHTERHSRAGAALTMPTPRSALVASPPAARTSTVPVAARPLTR